MAKRTKAQLKAKVDSFIKKNGNREITPEKHNSIETDEIDSFVSAADGGFDIDQPLGYSTNIPITDDRQFASKKYVDDNSGGGGFDPEEDYEFTGNNSFTKPVEIAEATENNHAVTLGQVIEIAELIEIDESGLVHKAGPETITGAKIFSASPTVPDGSSSGSAVNKGQLDTKLDKAIVEASKTGSFTVDAADAYKLYVINSGSAVTVTFPTSMSAGLWWDFVSIGTGAVSFVAGSSATLVSADSRLKLRAQYSACRIVARGSNQGLLTGDIVL